MDVTVNGATEAIAEPCSVAELLAARGHDTARVVVERNGEILPRERFAQTLLCGVIDAGRHKTEMPAKTITAAGEHNPANKCRLASFPSSALSASGAEPRCFARF